MKIERHYNDASKEERLNQEMQDEIDSQIKHLQIYNKKIKSLFGDSRSKEVKKALINYLVEAL